MPTQSITGGSQTLTAAGPASANTAAIDGASSWTITVNVTAMPTSWGAPPCARIAVQMSTDGWATAQLAARLEVATPASIPVTATWDTAHTSNIPPAASLRLYVECLQGPSITLDAELTAEP
jgi:hypothetical protein